MCLGFLIANSLNLGTGHPFGQVRVVPYKEWMEIASFFTFTSYVDQLKVPKIQLTLEGLELGPFEELFHDTIHKGITLMNTERFATWQPRDDCFVSVVLCKRQHLVEFSWEERCGHG